MQTAIAFRVIGLVQGVGFRIFVQRIARSLGLTGWVKNQSDGSVAGFAEGERGLLVDFIEQLRVGNRWSQVEGIEVSDHSFSGDFQRFEIRY